MNCSKCHTRVMWKEDGRTIVEGNITNINGVTYVECPRCKQMEWSKPPQHEKSAQERFFQGVEDHIGTPSQLSTLFWVLVVGGVFIVLFGLIMWNMHQR